VPAGGDGHAQTAGAGRQSGAVWIRVSHAFESYQPTVIIRRARVQLPRSLPPDRHGFGMEGSEEIDELVVSSVSSCLAPIRIECGWPACGAALPGVPELSERAHAPHAGDAFRHVLPLRGLRPRLARGSAA